MDKFPLWGSFPLFELLLEPFRRGNHAGAGRFTRKWLNSFDQVMAASNQVNPVSGQAIRVDDVFSDWILASYIKDGSVYDGRYTYANYPEAPQASSTEVIERCPSGVQNRDVSQFGGIT